MAFWMCAATKATATCDSTTNVAAPPCEEHRIRPDDPLEEAGVVVAEERVVGGEDVIGTGAVELGHEVQPHGHGVHSVMVVDAGKEV